MIASFRSYGFVSHGLGFSRTRSSGARGSSGRVLQMWALLAVAATAVGCADVATAPSASSGPACPSFVPASTGLPQDGEWRTHPSVADVNGDGLGDIAALPRKAPGAHVYLSDGLGGWSDSSEGLAYATSFSCGIGTRLTDVNLDGKVDLVIADHCDGLRVYHGDGEGRWTERSRGIPRNMAGFNDAAVGDLDQDGWPDIVAIAAFSSGFLVMRGRPAGDWEWVQDTGLPKVGSGFEIELYDVNGDGLLDIVSSFVPATIEKRDPVPPPAKVWLQGPPLRFRPADGFPEGGRYYGLAVIPHADRGPDLLFALIGHQAGIHRFEATEDGWTSVGRIDEAAFGPKPRGFIGLHAADLNADGCQDLMTVSADTRMVWVAMGDCAGHWEFCPEDTLPIDDPVVGWGVTTGDVNGDGMLDVVAGFGWKQRGSVKAWIQTQKHGSAVSSASLAPGAAPGEPNPPSPQAFDARTR